MKLIRLIRQNKSFRNITIILTFGWLFLVILTSSVFLMIVSNNTKYEVNELTSHYTHLFRDYNSKIKLVSTYFTEHTADIGSEEFDLMVEELVSDNTTIKSVSYAPQGVIAEVYPNQYNSLIGHDIMANSTIHENIVLLDSIENKSITYQYIVQSDQVTEILIRNPIFVDDEFYGFITFTIEQDVFSTSGFTHTSDFLNSGVYTEDGIYIYGYDDYDNYNLHKIELDDVTIYVGEHIRLDYVINNTSFLVGSILIFTLANLLAFTVLITVFTRLNKTTEELDFRRNYDTETHLFNIDRLYDDVAKMITNKDEFFLSFININNVKFINEKFGHIKTSKLLKKTTQLITRVLRENSQLYRYGGDEYVLVTKTTSKNELNNLLRRIIKIFDTDIVSENIRTRLSVSIGVTLYPNNGFSVEELVKNAHLTASEVKPHDRESFMYYKHDLINSKLINEDFDKMVAGLDLDLFEVNLMPIVDVMTNRISGFECLSRVYDEEGKRLPTEQVILSLERNGRIQQLDENVFKKMLAIMKRLNKEFPEEEFFLSLNASALSLNDQYVENVINYYKNAKLKKGSIVLELTESFQVEDYDYLINLFKKLNANGIKIGIDDFGSGYSSISYISKFPIFAIKVDKEYVRDYGSNDFNKTLLKTLISIAEVLNCKLVAEGVDSQDTLEFLQESNCPFYQGFLFSKGVTLEDAFALIKQNLNQS